MAALLPSARSIRHALRVLARLPVEAQADLAERIIDSLDLFDGDANLEDDDHDACEAEDMLHRLSGRSAAIGDADDAEPDADDELDEDQLFGLDELAAAWLGRNRQRLLQAGG